VWAFGVVLFEMVSGPLPFHAGGYRSRVRNHPAVVALRLRPTTSISRVGGEGVESRGAR